MKHAERFEDMSQRGRLRVFQQDDGDMIVEVAEDLNSSSPLAGLSASVEFCTSGGKSPKTLAALRALMVAMADDNADHPHCNRRGERGLGVDEGPPAATQAPAVESQKPFGVVTRFHDLGGEYDLLSPPNYRPPVGALLYASPAAGPLVPLTESDQDDRARRERQEASAAGLAWLACEGNDLRSETWTADEYGYIVVSHHMDEPRERIIGRGASPLEAIADARGIKGQS